MAKKEKMPIEDDTKIKDDEPNNAENNKEDDPEPLPEWLVTSQDPFINMFTHAEDSAPESDHKEDSKPKARIEDFFQQPCKNAPPNLQKDNGILKQEVTEKGTSSISDAKVFIAPSKDLKAFDGCDIVRKGNLRKGRKLCLFPGQISSRSAGRIGEVEDWDTNTPKIYIMFPEGHVMKLQGKTLHSKGRYIFLHCSNNNITCKDYYDSVVVFSEVSFVKKVEDGEEIITTDVPENLKQISSEKLNSLTHHGAGDPTRWVGCVGSSEEIQGAISTSITTKMEPKIEEVEGEDQDSSSQAIDMLHSKNQRIKEEEESSEIEIVEEVQIPQREVRERKRVKYTVPDSDEDNANEEDDFDDFDEEEEDYDLDEDF